MITDKCELSFVPKHKGTLAIQTYECANIPIMAIRPGRNGGHNAANEKSNFIFQPFNSTEL